MRGDNWGVSDRHDKQRHWILLAVLVFSVWACKMSIMLLLRSQSKLCVILYVHCSVQFRLKLLFRCSCSCGGVYRFFHRQLVKRARACISSMASSRFVCVSRLFRGSCP